MFANRFALAAIGAGCIAAAGVGGYIAARQTTTPAPIQAAASPAPAATPSAAPVQETEGVVGDTAKPAAPPQVDVATAAPSAKTMTPKPAAPAPRAAAKASAAPAAPQTLEHPWPSSAAGSPNAPSSQLPTPSPAPGTLAPSDGSSLPVPVSQEPPRAPEPPQKQFEELVVSAESVIGLQTENTISSERARVEDRVDARVTRDVRVDGRVAIPSGSRALGSVTVVERGGKFKERARLGVRFHTIVLADGTRLPISTDTVYREGQPPGNESAAKIGGGAVGGAILGAILGGAKGAVIGATTGGAAGAGAVAAGDRNAATLPSGTPVTVRLMSPVTVTVEK